MLGDLHLDGSTSGDDGVVLHSPPHDHDGVVKRPLGLLHELLGTSPQDDGARLALGDSAKDVEPLSTDLLIQKG